MLANDRTPAAAQPDVTSVVTASGEATRFEGTAAPGDRIIIRVNDRYAAETNADTDGRWRLQLPMRLPPGDHTAMAVAAAPGSVRVRVSGDIRISIPQPAIPQYAGNEDEPQGYLAGPEEVLPNDATRRRAAELARDANSEFSKLTAPEPDAEEAATPPAEPAGEASGSDDPEAFAFRDLLWPGRWLEAVGAWLARSSHDYNEILVTGLSDPERRHRYPARPDEIPAPAIPPLPDRPEHEPSRIGSLLTSAVAWLQQASSDYHQYVVQELALRGIEDPEQRQAAREAASAQQQAAAPIGQGEAKSEPTRPQPDRALENERIAESRRKEIAEANRHKEELMAEARKLADERARRAAEEEETLARRLAAHSREREREERQAEEKSIASALEQHLKQREQYSRLARRKQQNPDAAAAPDDVPATPGRTKPEAQQGPAETAAKPELTSPAIQEGTSTKSGGTVAAVPLPPRTSGVEQTGPAIDPPVRNRRRIARLPETAAQPPLPSRAREKLRDPPLPTRSLKLPANPPLPERGKRPVSVAASDTARRADPVDQARRIALPVRRPERHRRGAKNRNRWCKDPAAGRAIRTPGTYIVAYGDTLWDIAERHYGAGHLYRRIQRANGRRIARAGRIYPCQRLWLPRLARHRR